MTLTSVPTPEWLVRRFYDELWNQGNEAIAFDILAAQFRFRGSLGDEHVGIPGFLDYLRGIHRALGDYECLILDLVADHDRAAARMLFRGQHQDEFLEVPATGASIEWEGAAFFQIHAGKIDSLWVLGDLNGLKSQLGWYSPSFRIDPASARS